MKLQQLCFRTRLIIGFSTVLIISVLIISFSIFNIQRISKQTDLIYHHSFVVSNSVRDLDIYSNAIHRTMEDIVLAENWAQIDSSIVIVNEYDKKINIDFDVVFEKFTGNKEIVDEAHNVYIEWVLIRNKVIELIRDGKIGEAISVEKKKEAEHVKLLFVKNKILIDFAESRANDFLYNTKKTQKQSIVILILISIILLLISFIISLIISRSISEPIRKFISIIKQLPEFNLINNFRSIKNEQLMLEKVGIQLAAIYKNLKFQIEAKAKTEEELKKYRDHLEVLVEIRTHELGERVKELNCLYSISKIIEKQEIKLDQIFQEIVNIIPSSLQYPEITCARIIFNEQEFITQNFQDTKWKQKAKVIIDSKHIGTLEVCYLKEKPEIDEGVFLKDEKTLINVIAKRLGRVIKQKHTETTLQKNEERLNFFMQSATESFAIYDSNLELISINDKALEAFPTGTTREDLLRKNILELSPGLKETERYNKYLEVIETGKPITFKEVGPYTKFGNVILSISAFKVGEGLGLIYNDITERVRAEEEIRLQSQIMLNMPEGIYIVGIDDEIIRYTNEKFEKMFGYNSKEMIGKHVSVVNAPSNKTSKEVAKEIMYIMKKAGEWRGEIENIKKDGTRFWCYAIVSIFNHPVYGDVYLSVHTDITERKHMETRIKESEKKYREAERIARLGHWEFDVKNNKLYWSDEIFRQFGLEPQEFEPTFEILSQYFHPDDRDSVNKAFFESVKNNTPYDLEHRILLKTGEVKYVNTKGQAEFSETGELVRSIGMTLDITDRKIAEQALKESEYKFRAITNHATEGITVADMDGNYVFVNPSFCKMSGYTEKELLKMTVFDTKAKNQRHTSFNDRKSKMAGLPVHVNLQRKDGIEYITEVIGNKIEINKQEFVLRTIRDITRKVKAEQELIKAKEDAEDANQAKSKFLSRMSHELRTPLNSILGYSQILREEKNITRKQKDQIDTVLSSGQYLSNLINDILDIGINEAGKQVLIPTDFNLQDILNDVLNITKIDTEEKGLYFQYNTNQIPKIVRGDRRKVKQILLNLLSNAVKYTFAGGIDFFVGTKKGEENIIIFKIEDTGVGISKENMKVIFKPFNQFGKRYNIGTGLGLTITKSLIELMQGKLSISSTPGKGSCFTVELPFDVISNTIKRKEIDKKIIQLSGKKLQKEKKIPAVDILNKILNETEKGDYKKLEQIIHGLRKEDKAYTIFCNKLNNQAKKYDENSIIGYINSLKNN